MKKCILFISLILFFIGGVMADDIENAKKQINTIKKDNRYIYADVTADTKEEARSLAEESLYDSINEWVAKQKDAGRNVDAASLRKGSWVAIDMPRGNMFRSFLYVMKSDVSSVGNDKRGTSVSPVENNAVVSSSLSAETVIPELVMDIASCTEYADLAAKITRLKAEGKICEYGRYASLDNPQNYYLAVYNREGKIVAILSSGSNRINVLTKQSDSEKNYKGCGAIGFKLNN